MATKAERSRSEEQRAHTKDAKKSHGSVRKPKKAAWSRDKAHAGAKATHALEETAPGTRPSRESTRASANRAKPDTAFNLTEEAKKGSPENRARHSRTKTVRVRGGGASKIVGGRSRKRG
jgi:hypothetical protein